MKVRLLIFMALLWGWTSCSRDEEIPRGIIGREEMSAILLDMQMASTFNESYRPGSGPSDPTQRNEQVKIYYRQILELHHTDKEAFLKSYAFYEAHPNEMQHLYQRMKKEIDRKSAFEDSLRMKQERMRRQMKGEYSQPLKGKDFLMLYQSVADSIPRQHYRIFRPLGADSTQAAAP
jgi:hypothetical protein